MINSIVAAKVPLPVPSSERISAAVVVRRSQRLLFDPRRRRMEIRIEAGSASDAVFRERPPRRQTDPLVRMGRQRRIRAIVVATVTIMPFLAQRIATSIPFVRQTQIGRLFGQSVIVRIMIQTGRSASVVMVMMVVVLLRLLLLGQDSGRRRVGQDALVAGRKDGGGGKSGRHGNVSGQRLFRLGGKTDNAGCHWMMQTQI